MKNRFYIIFFFCGLLFSCREEIDPSVLFKPKKSLVVINGTLSPQDQIIKIQVSKSISIIDVVKVDKGIDASSIIKNASVFLKGENTKEVKLTYSEKLFSYIINSSDFSIEGGKQYFLRVLVGADIYTSRCKIPMNKVEELKGKYNSQVENSNLEETVSIEIKDIEGINNYYVFGAKFNNDRPLNFDLNSDQYITDKRLDGKTIKTKATTENRFVFGSNEIAEESDAGKFTKVTIQVANVEENLYNLLRIQNLNKENEEDFAVDQAVSPSNIIGKNAFGIFAGYQLTEKEISVE